MPKSDLTDATTLPPQAVLLSSSSPCLLIISSKVVKVNLVVILNLQADLSTEAPEKVSDLESASH